MFGNNKALKSEIRELEYKVDDLGYRNRTLQYQVNRFERTQEINERENKDKIEDLEYEHAKIDRQNREEIEKLVEKLDRHDSLAYAEEVLAKKEADLEAYEVELEARAAIIGAMENSASKFKEKIDEVKNQGRMLADQKFELGKAQGLAEGLAEGLRSAHEITEKDRGNMFSIASKALDRDDIEGSASTSNVTVNATSKSD